MRNALHRNVILVSAIGAALALAGCDRASTNSASSKVDRAADKVAATASDATNKVAAVADDAAITAKVKTALMAEPGLKSLDISVDTKDATVTLSGVVDNSASRDRAKDVATNIAGVKGVVDQMAVKS